METVPIDGIWSVSLFCTARDFFSPLPTRGQTNEHPLITVFARRAVVYNLRVLLREPKPTYRTTFFGPFSKHHLGEGSTRTPRRIA